MELEPAEFAADSATAMLAKIDEALTRLDAIAADLRRIRAEISPPEPP